MTQRAPISKAALRRLVKAELLNPTETPVDPTLLAVVEQRLKQRTDQSRHGRLRHA
jgi:hypothetical protein